MSFEHYNFVRLQELYDEATEEIRELKERIEYLEEESAMYKRFWEETEYTRKELEQEYVK